VRRAAHFLVALIDERTVVNFEVGRSLPVPRAMILRLHDVVIHVTISP
jgi:hypothetical protein